MGSGFESRGVHHRERNPVLAGFTACRGGVFCARASIEGAPGRRAGPVTFLTLLPGLLPGRRHGRQAGHHFAPEARAAPAVSIAVRHGVAHSPQPECPAERRPIASFAFRFRWP